MVLAGGLVWLNTGLYADNRVSANNPFEPIAVRNIFGLNPPQAPAPVDTSPPATITPNGIMTIFGGTPQVLFKVAVPPRPPEPATDKSYILSEGQRQDDIEVTHIDKKGGIVTFNNHGVVQEIPLVKAPPISTPTPVVMNSAFTAPGAAPGGFGGPGGGRVVRRPGWRKLSRIGKSQPEWQPGSQWWKSGWPAPPTVFARGANDPDCRPTRAGAAGRRSHRQDFSPD